METIINRHAYKYDIFISYASEDKEFVKSVVLYLEEYGYSIWRDDDILSKYSGERYDAHIDEGIDDSAVFLYIHSEKSKDKWYVQEKEIPYALEQGKRILIYAYGDVGLQYRHPELIKLERVIAREDEETGEKNELYGIRCAVQRTFGDITASGKYVKLETNGEIFSREQLQARLRDVVFIWPIPESRRERLKEYGFFSEPAAEGDLHRQLRCFLECCPSVMQVDAYLEETACEVADEFVKKIEEHKTIFNGPMLGVSSIIARRSADGREVRSLELEMYRSDYFTFKLVSRIYQKLIKDEEQGLFAIQRIEDIPRFAPFLCSLGMGGFVVTPDAGGGKALWIKRSGACEASHLYHFSYDETVAVMDVKDKEVDLYGTLYRGVREELGLSDKDLTGQGGIFEIGIILTRDRIELEMLSYLVLKPSMYAGFGSQLDAAEDSKLEVGKHFFLRFNEYRRELADKKLTPEALALIKRLEVRNNNQQLFSNFQYSALAQVGESIEVGQNVMVDDFVIIGNRCRIGNNCKIHYFSHIDDDVVIGNNVKIQNNVMIPHGVTLEDGVFVGPSVVFTNDKHPRSVTPEGDLKTGDDWNMTPTLIKEGASLGGGAVIVCGVSIGRWAMVGAGAVVTKDVPNYALVLGCPAKVVGKVNEKGEVVERY